MSRNGDVTFFFGDAPHKFRMALKELQEFEEKFDIGAELVLRRLLGGDWRIAQIRELHRIGLIGGGMKPAEAYRLVERYASDPPFEPIRHGAQVILHSALFGAPDGEKPGKRSAAKGTSEQKNAPTESSPSPPSTGPVLQ